MLYFWFKASYAVGKRHDPFIVDSLSLWIHVIVVIVNENCVDIDYFA